MLTSSKVIISMIRSVLAVLILAFSLVMQGCSGCSCGCGSKGGPEGYQIAIDPTFYPVDFGEKNVYVIGFIEDVLLEISRISNMRFQKITTGWDTLLSGLKQGKYQAVISSMAPHSFNKAEYNYSEDILSFGPVMLMAEDAKPVTLANMPKGRVGVIYGSPTVFLVEKYPAILISNFDSYPDLLSALVDGHIDAALMNTVDAAGYLNETFYKKIKITGSPLTDQALRLVTVKDKNNGLMRSFESALHKLKKEKTYQKLLIKWQLAPES